MSTRRSYSNNMNNNNNNNNVIRVATTPQQKQKSVNNRKIVVRISMNKFNKFKEYMNENNIEIPSGQSEYSQRLANLDIEHNRLKQLHKNLIKLYNNLYKECKKNNKITRYGKRKKTIHTRKNNRGENETNNFFYPGINDIPIGNSTV